MQTDLNSRVFTYLSYALLLATAAAAAYLFMDGRLVGAAVLAGLIGLAIIFIAQRDKLPSIFTLFFVFAAVINAAGYIFDLWKTPTWFDEFVHFYTSFTVMAAIGWLLFSRTRVDAAGHTAKFVLSVVVLGIGLGILWEIFEWIIGIIGNRWDTILDLIMDTIGAVIAGLFCGLAAKTIRGSGGHAKPAASH